MSAILRSGAGFLVLLSLAALAVAQTPLGGRPSDPPPVAEPIRQLMQDRNYPEAVKALDAAAAAKDAPRDYLLYLKGWALHLNKQYDAALAVYDQIEKEFPQGHWTRRARFAKGAALVRKGDFKSAEAIYQAEAQYLLSDPRRHASAELFLEFADAHFKPPRDDQQPNYEKALAFYTQALPFIGKPDLRADVELRIAQCHQNLKQPAEAATLYTQFLETYPQSPLAVEARFRLGECRLAEGNPREARRVWQDLVARAPHAPRDDRPPLAPREDRPPLAPRDDRTPLAPREDRPLAEREEHGHATVYDKPDRVAEAAFQISRTFGMPAPKTDDDLARGTAALESFLEKYPKHKLAGQAVLDIAGALVHRDRPAEAAARLAAFVKDERFQDRPELPLAWQLLGETYKADHKYPEAIAAWQEFLTRFPSHALWSNVQQAIITAEYEMGLAPYRRGDFAQARKLLEAFLQKHPLDRRGPGVLYLFGQMSYEEKKYDEALDQWRRLVTKHPGSEEASQAQYRIAQTLEQDLHKPQEALEAYRKLNWGKQAQAAGQALARLIQRELTVRTVRTYRSDETPQLHLTTRNLESVQVRVYKIDFEAFFRKMHATGAGPGAKPGAGRGLDINQLDIGLIDPDRQFEFKLPGYEKYKEIRSPVDVGLEKQTPGALAVTVSSKSHEATSLVLQSDLEIIVHASQAEVFVFAQNMRTQKPWPKARVLVSDGRAIIAEGVTNDEGVFRQALAELKDAVDVRVLAVAEGHVASNVLSIAGSEGVSWEPAMGQIEASRLVYRPGQRVELRGFLPKPANAEKQRTVAIEVRDPRNRQVWRQERLAVGPFGTFRTALDLPSLAPPGEYKIVVDADVKVLAPRFEVRELPTEPIHLLIEGPNRVFVRGEAIEGTIRAVWYNGEPAVGKEIYYRLQDEPEQMARTDANGEVRFKFATDEASGAIVRAGQAPQKIETARVWSVLSADLKVRISVPRIEKPAIYLTGEPIALDVATTNAQDEPVTAKLTLRVIQTMRVKDTRPNRAGSERATRLVEERPIATDATGRAKIPLELKAGGEYRVRVDGLDGLKNLVADSIDLTVSHERDDARLLAFAERRDYRPGEAAAVSVSWRDAPATALLTVQSEDGRVLQHRPVVLKTGTTKFAVAMAENFAPSVLVEFDVMTSAPRPEKGKPAGEPGSEALQRPRLHRAATLFRVNPSLKIDLAWKTKDGGPPRPGEPIELTVTTADARGKPLAADVGLNLLPALLQSPLEAFGKQGDHAVKRYPGTGSSIDFQYFASDLPIPPRLISDRDRRQLEVEDEANRRAIQQPPSPPTQPGAMSFPRGTGTTPPIWLAQVGGSGRRTPSSLREPSTADDASFEWLLEWLAEPRPPIGWEIQSTPPRANDPFAPVPANQPDKPTAPQPFAVLTAIDQPGYWNPSVVTGADGKATLVLTLPDKPGAYRLFATVFVEEMSGSQEAKLETQRRLPVAVRCPEAATEGDTMETTAVVEVKQAAPSKIEAVLKTTIDGAAVEETKTVQTTGPGRYAVSFKTAIRRPEKAAARQDAATLNWTLRMGEAVETVQRTVLLRPAGVPVVVNQSGVASADAAVTLEMPQKLQSPRLAIRVSPTLERSLLDAALAPQDNLSTATPVEAAASDLLAAMAVRPLLLETMAAERAALDARVRVALAQLIVTQQESGGWSWTGAKGQPDRFTSARAAWALALAAKNGYPVPDETTKKAIEFLRAQAAEVDPRDYETRAVLLHALAVLGQGDFTLANQFHRERKELSPAALAYLALTLVELDRKSMAEEVLALLAQQDLDAKNLPWNGSPAEIRALVALAALAVAPASPQSQQMVDWLLAHRTQLRWSPDKATGPAALALGRWLEKNRSSGEPYKLTVTMNDKPLTTLDLTAAGGTQIVDVPLDGAGNPKIAFQPVGKGRYAYDCRLSGSLADKPGGPAVPWQVERRYQPAPREVDGRPVRRGFDIVEGRYRPFFNTMTQLPLGSSGTVELTIARQAGGPSDAHEYLVLVEPLPAGATVRPGSVAGSFERYEARPGALVLYFGNQPGNFSARYEIDGAVLGAYTAPPAVAASAYRPERRAVATATPLAVLPQGAATTDPYRLSPVELLELGTRAAAKKDWKTAAAHLGELVENWTLKPEAHKQALFALLDAHLEIGPAAKAVHDFEIVQQRWPSDEIAFPKIMKIAAAYHEIGEFERAYLSYRAVVEGSFTRESGVAGFLEEQGEFLRSTDRMAGLLADYPPEPYVAEAQYALAQQIRAKAATVADDARLREQRIERADLVRRAWWLCESFLTAWPEHPMADQAALAAASALLELKDYAAASAAAARYAVRYPQSELLDTFWYVQGYSQFALGQYKEALETCRKVAEHQQVDKKTGRAVESRNKHQAIFIMGQVYQAMNQPADAIREYRRVADRFADARLSIAWLSRKAVELPEVTTVRPGQPAEVELKARNVPDCEVLVYRIDLMKFSALKGDLSGITRVNLAGVRPLHEASVKLEGPEHREQVKKLPLPLDKEGAYLVVCRGGPSHASGLVLVTPLAVEVQVDRGTGQLRTMVKDAAADRHVSGAEVRVIGSRNPEFVSGETDFRGVFTAAGIQGVPTVIVQAGPGRYAFYRGPGAVTETAPEGALVQQGEEDEGEDENERPDPFGPPPAGENPFSKMPPGAKPKREPRTPPTTPSADDIARMEKEADRRPGGEQFQGLNFDESLLRLRKILASPTQLEFVETPLADVLKYLSEYHKVTIAIDQKALDDVGIGTDTPITRSLKGVTLRSALALLLRDLNLTYIPGNDVILITTPEEAGNRLVTVIYPVADLVLPPGSNNPDDADYDSLIDTLTATIQPNTWDDVGGAGSITPFENKQVLVVSQTAEVQEQISDVLALLRKSGGKDAAATAGGQAQKADEQVVSPKDAQPSAGRRARSRRGQGNESLGGMGGGMGGMGGMGFGGQGKGGGPMPSGGAQEDLLQGLNAADQQYQEQGAQRLKSRQKKGQNYGGMGGMGGGFF